MQVGINVVFYQTIIAFYQRIVAAYANVSRVRGGIFVASLELC